MTVDLLETGSSFSLIDISSNELDCCRLGIVEGSGKGN